MSSLISQLISTILSPRWEVFLAISLYSMCSGTLVLVNKLILSHLPYPSLVISTQLVGCIAFIWGAAFCKILQVDSLQWKYVVPYLYYTVAFSMGVYCNMKSLQHSNVETVIVFRALTPCIVSLLDVLFLGREYPSRKSWTGLGLLVLGAYGYALKDPQFQTQGYDVYFWPTSYLVAISIVMAYGKKIIQSVDLKTQSGPVLYTNLLGFPPMLLFAHMGDEYRHFWEDLWLRDTTAANTTALFTPSTIFLLILGTVIGTAIGYTSWWCRDKVSATSFTLIGVMNKCLTVLLNMLVWDQHAPPLGIASLFICLLGGSIYQQAPMRSGAHHHTEGGKLLGGKSSPPPSIKPKPKILMNESSIVTSTPTTAGTSAAVAATTAGTSTTRLVLMGMVGKHEFQDDDTEETVDLDEEEQQHAPLSPSLDSATSSSSSSSSRMDHFVSSTFSWMNLMKLRGD